MSAPYQYSAGEPLHARTCGGGTSSPEAEEGRTLPGSIYDEDRESIPPSWPEQMWAEQRAQHDKMNRRTEIFVAVLMLVVLAVAWLR